MNKNKIATIVLTALSLINFMIGGIMGFALIGSENRKTFAFVFLACIAAAAVGFLCDWLTLRQAEREMEYRVLKIRKGRLVREPKKMERDIDGLRTLEMGFRDGLSH